MKNFILFITLIVSFVTLVHGLSINSGEQKHYMGQKPPGLIPEVFAPGLISTENFEFGGAFTIDGKEFYFTRRNSWASSANRIYFTRLVNGKWTKPVKPDFAQNCFEFEPTITPDGKKMFFYSERKGKRDKKFTGDLWHMNRTAKGWSSPEFFKSPVNKKYVMMLTSSLKGTLFFSGIFNRQRGAFTSSIEKKYTDITPLPETVNSIDPAHPFIAPDESYILMDAQVTGMGKPELFISFKKPDGNWTKPVNMGKTINRTKTEFGATVSPDGKYMFFHRRENGRGDIYWVSTAIIDKIKSATFK